MNILIRNGRLIDPAAGVDKPLDVYIADGAIVEIGENLDYGRAETTVIDASGKIVAPGLVDMHCHLREPGFEYKEDIESGTRAAAAGGITSVACMPNTEPVLDNAPLVEYVQRKARQYDCANVYPVGAVTRGLEGKELADIGEMKFAGAVAVSDDGKPVSDPLVMRRALEYAAMFDMPVISHCEELRLLDGGTMNEGAVSTRLGLKGIPNAAEDAQIARDVLLAELTGAALHIAHVSTRGGVELVRRAKEKGIRVTCETCPHYFALTDEAVGDFDTNAKMNPPLRSRADVDAVLAGLADGTVDAIATDHAPHHIDEKNLEFAEAANGIIGFETLLGLGITYLVKTGVLTMNEFLKKVTANPARILGLNKGRLAVNKPADIVIFNDTEKYTVDKNAFQSKSRNTPFHGFTLYGKAEYTIVGGKIVVSQGVVV
jgi:dihydroorotase